MKAFIPTESIEKIELGREVKKQDSKFYYTIKVYPTAPKESYLIQRSFTDVLNFDGKEMTKGEAVFLRDFTLPTLPKQKFILTKIVAQNRLIKINHYLNFILKNLFFKLFFFDKNFGITTYPPLDEEDFSFKNIFFEFFGIWKIDLIQLNSNLNFEPFDIEVEKIKLKKNKKSQDQLFFFDKEEEEEDEEEEENFEEKNYFTLNKSQVFNNSNLSYSSASDGFFNEKYEETSQFYSYTSNKSSFLPLEKAATFSNSQSSYDQEFSASVTKINFIAVASSTFDDTVIDDNGRVFKDKVFALEESSYRSNNVFSKRDSLHQIQSVVSDDFINSHSLTSNLSTYKPPISVSSFADFDVLKLGPSTSPESENTALQPPLRKSSLSNTYFPSYSTPEVIAKPQLEELPVVSPLPLLVKKNDFSESKQCFQFKNEEELKFSSLNFGSLNNSNNVENNSINEFDFKKKNWNTLPKPLKVVENYGFQYNNLSLPREKTTPLIVIPEQYRFKFNNGVLSREFENTPIQQSIPNHHAQVPQFLPTLLTSRAEEDNFEKKENFLKKEEEFIQPELLPIPVENSLSLDSNIENKLTLVSESSSESNLNLKTDTNTTSSNDGTLQKKRNSLNLKKSNGTLKKKFFEIFKNKSEDSNLIILTNNEEEEELKKKKINFFTKKDINFKFNKKEKKNSFLKLNEKEKKIFFNKKKKKKFVDEDDDNDDFDDDDSKKNISNYFFYSKNSNLLKKNLSLENFFLKKKKNFDDEDEINLEEKKINFFNKESKKENSFENNFSDEVVTISRPRLMEREKERNLTGVLRKSALFRSHSLTSTTIQEINQHYLDINVLMDIDSLISIKISRNISFKDLKDAILLKFVALLCIKEEEKIEEIRSRLETLSYRSENQWILIADEDGWVTCKDDVFKFTLLLIVRDN
ncbi:hypothetical protein HDU92_008715 [Lobulomyces angularis]|nr:hypothetical protein HDU92_008715 [Lobulomyces angularis]